MQPLQFTHPLATWLAHLASVGTAKVSRKVKRAKSIDLLRAERKRQREARSKNRRKQ